VTNPHPVFVSGFGQYHSDRSGTNPKPYVTCDWQAFNALLEAPPSKAKEHSQWLIFSTLPSRNADEQRANGRFHALWADIDDAQGLTIAQTVERANQALGDVRLYCYSSRSATEANQKARIVVPLAESVCGQDFELMQCVLNDRLEAAGVMPDRATERANQVMFLPNRGEYYAFERLEGPPINAGAQFACELDVIKQRQRQQLLDSEAVRERSRLKAVSNMAAGCTSPVAAFNQAYDLETMLSTFGYRKRGNRYLSPLSDSGVAGVTVSGDRWHSQHGSDVAAGLGRESNGACSGDAFDLFVYFEHGGDYSAALKAAGAMFTADNGKTITQANQQVYMQAQEVVVPVDERLAANDEVFDLRRFALNGQSAELEAKMLSDSFVLGKLAILGQATVFYAKPNSGKTLLTLWLLAEAIKAGSVEAKDVFYINADDNYKGLVIKLKLAEQYGFQQLAPNFNGFQSDMFLRYLQKMIDEQTASGKVVILDTLKKFTDVMDKSVATAFGKAMRAFVSSGGTLIMLAHTNKHRGADDKLIFSGTSDIVDDVDCAYTLDVIEATSDAGLKTVVFENIKARGDVADSATYAYSSTKGQDYIELFSSVREIHAADAEQLKHQEQVAMILRKNAEVIEAASDAINGGITLKTELIAAVTERTDLSKAKVIAALKAHTGSSYIDGHRWQCMKGDKNAMHYRELLSFSAPLG
jgi:hypothetical protein